MDSTNPEAQITDPSSLAAPAKKSPRWLEWLLFALILGCFWFGYTRYLEWPFYLHPDERGKAEQVIEKDYNFNHPMLMLLSAERAVKVLREVSDFERNYQTVTEVGRAAVAFWLAAGVAALCLLGWRWFGWIGLVVLLLLFAADGHGYRAAQSFKEDGVLLGTLGLFFLSFDSFVRRLSAQVHHAKALNRQLLFAGLCLGLVAASKYVGIILWPVAIVALACITPSPHKFASALWLLAFAVLGFLLPNYPMVLDFGGMKGGLEYEFQSLVHGHDGVRAQQASTVNAQAISALSQGFLPPLIWLSLLCVPLIFWLQARQSADKRSRAHSALLIALMMLAFSLLLLLALSLTPKFVYRYLTPIIWLSFASLGFAASALINEVKEALSKGLSQFQPQKLPALIAGCALLAGLVFTQWQSWKPSIKGPAPLPEEVKNSPLLSQILPWSQRQILNWETKYHNSLQWHRMYAEGFQVQNAITEAVAALPADAVVLMPHQPLLPAQDNKRFKNIPSPVEQTVYWDKKVAKDSSLQLLQAYRPTHVLFQESIHERFERSEVQGDAKAVEEFYQQRYFWRNLRANSQRLDWGEHIRGRPVLTHGWDLRELKAPEQQVIQKPPAR